MQGQAELTACSLREASLVEKYLDKQGCSRALQAFREEAWHLLNTAAGTDAVEDLSMVLAEHGRLIARQQLLESVSKNPIMNDLFTVINLQNSAEGALVGLESTTPHPACAIRSSTATSAVKRPIEGPPRTAGRPNAAPPAPPSKLPAQVQGPWWMTDVASASLVVLKEQMCVHNQPQNGSAQRDLAIAANGSWHVGQQGLAPQTSWITKSLRTAPVSLPLNSIASITQHLPRQLPTCAVPQSKDGAERPPENESSFASPRPKDQLVSFRRGSYAQVQQQQQRAAQSRGNEMLHDTQESAGTMVQQASNPAANAVTATHASTDEDAAGNKENTSPQARQIGQHPAIPNGPPEPLHTDHMQQQQHLIWQADSAILDLESGGSGMLDLDSMLDAMDNTDGGSLLQGLEECFDLSELDCLSAGDLDTPGLDDRHEM
ncbi:hypothetical protein WJX84_005210 [Apatococcus fuscideae]|uniref:LisH domain-containing protein n=1 Tax=Apatococcus fuscideae TaxID=2026836 RepID=A0AAW1T8E2_9CHLO